MRKAIAAVSIAAFTLAAPIAIETAFTAAQSHAVTITAKGHGHGDGGTHHSTGKRAHRERASFKTDTCMEDEPCWSCVDDGNRVCGPSNTEGKPPGCYDDGGVLAADWPCKPWQPNMGYRHPDGTTTFPNGDVMDDNGNVLVPGDHSHDIPNGGIDGVTAGDPDELVYQKGYRN